MDFQRAAVGWTTRALEQRITVGKLLSWPQSSADLTHSASRHLRKPTIGSCIPILFKWASERSGYELETVTLVLHRCTLEQAVYWNVSMKLMRWTYRSRDKESFEAVSQTSSLVLILKALLLQNEQQSVVHHCVEVQCDGASWVGENSSDRRSSVSERQLRKVLCNNHNSNVIGVIRHLIQRKRPIDNR